MDLLSPLLQFSLAALVVVGAGIFLTRFSDAIAEETKLGGAIVGLILLAGATSLPELSVSFAAARQGLNDVAVGDLFGSNLFNLLILGVIDLTHKSKGRMLSRQSAHHALAGALSIVLMAIAVVGIVLRSDFAPLGIGFFPLAAVLVWSLGIRMVALNERRDDQNPPTIRLTKSLNRKLLGYAAAAGVIIVSAPFLSDAAGEISRASGVSQTFIGTSLVALATSLPELVTTLTALRLGSINLAIGNLLGSNAANIALLTPVDLAAQGAVLAAVSMTHALTLTCAILVTGVVLMGQLFAAEKRIRLIEPDATLVILLVVASLYGIWLLGAAGP